MQSKRVLCLHADANLRNVQCVRSLRRAQVVPAVERGRSTLLRGSPVSGGRGECMSTTAKYPPDDAKSI